MSAAPLSPSAIAKTRILVVDDITKNLQVVGTMLRNAGYEVMPTTSGAQALERVRVQLPDLILLDLMMPEMDGWAFRQAQLQDAELCGIPVVVMSASRGVDDAVLGGAEILQKPIGLQEILGAVERNALPA